jgi:hypothetical protein
VELASYGGRQTPRVPSTMQRAHALHRARRSRRLRLTVHPEEVELIEEQARAVGMSVAAYLRAVVDRNQVHECFGSTATVDTWVALLRLAYTRYRIAELGRWRREHLQGASRPRGGEVSAADPLCRRAARAAPGGALP